MLKNLIVLIESLKLEDTGKVADVKNE